MIEGAPLTARVCTILIHEILIQCLTAGLVMCLCAGLTKAQLQAAFGIDSAIDISTFNALADALNKGGSGPGLPVLKVLSLGTFSCTACTCLTVP